MPDRPDPELERVVRRWRELPLDHALGHVPAVRALAQHLADEVHAARGARPVPLPQLGPASTMDQLVVTAYDARQAGLAQRVRLTERLAELRRSL